MNIIKLSIERPLFITMTTVFFAVIGLLCLKKLPVNLYPDITYPVITVRGDLDGASPETIEALVTRRLEDALSSVSGVKNMRSVSRAGSAFVSLEFSVGEDIRFQEGQIRAKVANIRKSLPAEMSDPVVQRQDPDDTPIVEVALWGPLSASELTTFANDHIVRPLAQLKGVGQIELFGDRQPEIKVNLIPESLDTFHFNASEIVDALKKSNQDNPIGTLKSANRNWLVRGLSQPKNIDALGDVNLGKSILGAPIFLSDVAEIASGFEDVRRVSFIGNKDGLKPGILVRIVKQSGENTVEVSDRIIATVKKIQSQLPQDISLKITQDNAELVRSNVAEVFESLILAGALTIAVVLLFLRSPRSTFTTGIALPSSVITTFAIIYFAGFSINIMTLLALSLSIGLLVDDAIVVRENIFRHLHTDKRSGPDAAYIGTREVSLAVVATTATLVAMFLPVSQMDGVIGQFFKPFALTVVFAMLVSLWDALTMAPLLSAYYANIDDPAKEWLILGRLGFWIHSLLEKFDELFNSLSNLYVKVLKKLIDWPVISILIAIISLGGAYFGFINVKKSFLPTQLGSTFSMSLEGPLALPLDRVKEVTTVVQEKLENTSGLDNWTVTAGTGFSGNANINVTLRVGSKFSQNQSALAKVRQEIRKNFSDIAGYALRVSEPADPLAGASGGRFQPIVVNISGDDFVNIRETAREVRSTLTKIKGITDVSPLNEEGLPEIQFQLPPRNLAQYGVSADLATRNFRIWLDGDASNRMTAGDLQIPKRVAVKNANVQSAEALLSQNFYIRSAGNRELIVPAANFTSIKIAAGPASINRENRQRLVRVSANLSDGFVLSDVISELKQQLSEIPLKDKIQINLSGQADQMNELFDNIQTALILGSIFVFMVLASLFESIFQPLTVMAAIPLAATGGVVSLLLCDMPLDLYGGIGMILLAGIVAKNSILLVDFATQNVQKNNQDAKTAILETAPLRLRPILMTSAAMIVGMLPVALGMGAGGATRKALGITTIGGVISSTVLTLLVVPNLFVFMAKLAKIFKAIREKLTAPTFRL